MGSGVQQGLGEGPIKIVWSNVPIPRIPLFPRHACWLILAPFVCVLYPTLLLAAEGDLFPHVGGTVTHRAQFFLGCSGTELVTNIGGPIKSNQPYGSTAPHLNSLKLVSSQKKAAKYFLSVTFRLLLHILTCLSWLSWLYLLRWPPLHQITFCKIFKVNKAQILTFWAY